MPRIRGFEAQMNCPRCGLPMHIASHTKRGEELRVPVYVCSRKAMTYRTALLAPTEINGDSVSSLLITEPACQNHLEPVPVTEFPRAYAWSWDYKSQKPGENVPERNK